MDVSFCICSSIPLKAYLFLFFTFATRSNLSNVISRTHWFRVSTISYNLSDLTLSDVKCFNRYCCYLTQKRSCYFLARFQELLHLEPHAVPILEEMILVPLIPRLVKHRKELYQDLLQLGLLFLLIGIFYLLNSYNIYKFFCPSHGLRLTIKD